MADVNEGLTITCEDQSIDYHIVTIFEKLETLRRDGGDGRASGLRGSQQKTSMQVEIRTLEFWRSIISECLASFLYVFVVCGAAAGVESAGDAAGSNGLMLVSAALASGFAMATMVQCFGHVSGAHVNPAVTLAMAVVRNVSPLRAAMYITAQCGGGIAGAALLYGYVVNNTRATIRPPAADLSRTRDSSVVIHFGHLEKILFIVHLYA